MALTDIAFGELLEQVAAKSPAPGGGAVTAAVAALGVSLAQMSLAYSMGKKSLAAHQGELERVSAKLQSARAVLLELAEEDARAFEAVGSLMRLEKDDPRRKREMPGAALAAINAPRGTIAVCSDVLRALEGLSGKTNPNLRSDLAIAAELLETAARSSRWNVELNVPLLEEGEVDGAIPGSRVLQEVDDMLAALRGMRDRIVRGCRSAS